MATGTGTTGVLALGVVTTLGAVGGLNYGVGAVTLPALTVSGHGPTGAGVTSVDSNCVLPALTVVGYGGNPPSLPALQVHGFGVTGSRPGVGAVTLPALTVFGANPRIVLPALRVAGTGVTGGGFGHAAIELPALEVSGTGAHLQVGTGSVVLPRLQVIGAGVAPLPAASSTAGAPGSGTGLEFGSGEALVLNLRTSAATTYANYGFNSFAAFNGVTLGANADGIFVVGAAADDAGTDIDARLRFGETDFETSYMKLLARAYVGLRTDGEMHFKVRVDEDEWRTYLLEDRAALGMHSTRVKIGKGLRGRYWQAEIANFAGADFDIDAVELAPALLRRKVA